jgi:hypothetical protein
MLKVKAQCPCCKKSIEVDRATPGEIWTGLAFVGLIVASILVASWFVGIGSAQRGTFQHYFVEQWNDMRSRSACVVGRDVQPFWVESEHLKPGDHFVCDGGESTGAVHHQLNDWPPSQHGYRAVWHTTGGPHDPVGWVLVPGGTCQPEDLNCYPE